MQGALEMIGLPYTGSGVMGSALGMDKLRTKRLAAALGVGTADSVVLRQLADCAQALERLGLPLIVKRPRRVPSVGMSKVTTREEMEPAYRAAAAVDDTVFAEKWITGAEYTVAVLHRRVLPAIRIEAANAFYDYEPSTTATTRSTTAPPDFRRSPRRTSRASHWQLSMQWVRRVGAARISCPTTPGGRCCSRSTPCPA